MEAAFAMTANLTAQYHKAEEQYRRATTPAEEVSALELMFRELPKHKGTDRLQADLKTRISKAKKAASDSKDAGSKGPGVRIPRQGAGRVVLLGGPNAGKSQLVASLTSATPEIAPYPFTTRTASPAMMPWEDVMIQLIDTPPITADYLEAYMQGIIRGADVVLLVIDLGSDSGMEECHELLTRLGNTRTRLACESCLDEDDIGLSFTRTIVATNKIDAEDAADRLELLHELLPMDFPEYVVSAKTGDGLDELREALFTALDVVRVYTKLPTAKKADYDRPFTIRRGGTIADVAELVHRDIAENLKSARVWGSAIHDGTTVKTDYEPNDKDVVELHV